MSNQEKIISLLDHAVQMHQASQLEEAEELYNKVLILSPHQYDALNLLGVIADQRGNTDQAINLFNQAINASPNLVTAHYNKANTLRDNKQLGEAEVSYKNALTCNPKSQDALLNLGVILQDQNRTEEALAKFLELIKIAPKNAKAHYNKGKTLHKAGNLSDAEKALKKAIKLDPSNAYSHFALANICDDLNKNEDAIKYIQKAIEIRPEWGQAYSNLGNFLKNSESLQEALKAYKKSLEIEPENHTTRTNLGILQLYMQEFEKGWENYSYKSKSNAPFYKKHNFNLPTWNGEDLSKENILLWNEQGLGDEILYASMIREFCLKTKSCSLLCSDKLRAIFKNSFADINNLTILENQEIINKHSNYDKAISLTDLGRYLRPSSNSFPLPQAYLKFDESKKIRIRSYLETNFGSEKQFIGISWSSKNPLIGDDKSIPIEAWIPFLKLSNIQFINLQYGEKLEDLKRLPKRIQPLIASLDSIDLNGDLKETLELLSALDLLVTCSNTTAHLAGASGLPVWILAPKGKSLIWYWFFKGFRSLWYRNARIFRLQNTRQWKHLINEVIEFFEKNRKDHG